MSRFDEIRNIAKQEVEQRKKEIERLEAKIAQLELDQKDLENEMIVMLEWVEDLKNQQEQLQQECENLEAEIKEKKLPCSLLDKCTKVLSRMKAARLNNKEEKGLKVTLTKQERKELASELVGQSNIGVDLKPLVQEAINSEE